MAQSLRINKEMNLKEAVLVMAEGNPGALRALMELATKAGMFWPTPFGRLDEAGVYGSRIWMLYKDIFNYDARAMALALKMLGVPAIITGQNDLYRQEWSAYGGYGKATTGQTSPQAPGPGQEDKADDANAND